MRQFTRRLAPVLALLATAGFVSSRSQGPVVRAVLFFLPTCPHCHEVIQRRLPGIFDRFGGPAQVFYDQRLATGQVPFFEVSNGRLEILLVDASVPEGGDLYRSWLEAHHIPQEQWGVPRLLIADTTLYGSVDIPELLPRFIEDGLAAGGIDWPRLPGMDQALASIPAHVEPVPEGEVAEAPATTPEEPAEGAAEVAAAESPGDTTGPAAAPGEPSTAPAGSTPAVEASTTAAEASTPPAEAADTAAPAAEPAAEAPAAALDVIPRRALPVSERFKLDPLGNSFSVVVLILMIVSVVAVFMLLTNSTAGGKPGLAIPIVALIGALVAGYLTYVETSGAAAVCGPVGDCNTVNQSEYAWLFGVIPVGLLGLIGYAGLLAAWVAARFAPAPLADGATVAVMAIASFGTLFSIYLTFLEPFVIGATCAWCLTSAVTITLLMWLSARPAKESWLRLSRERQ